jgi:hypothetical protein
LYLVLVDNIPTQNPKIEIFKDVHNVIYYTTIKMNTHEQINHLPPQIQKQIYSDLRTAKELYSKIKSALKNSSLVELSALLGEVLENPTVLAYLQTKIPTFIETQRQIHLSHQTKDEFATLWYKILLTQ